jgi:endogenous inhibitor of DNA gyrase (YacG/DUF329 family)
MVTTVKCPTCRRPVEWTPDSAHRPFCSERCRLIDLGAWFDEKHRIPDESPGAADESIPDTAEES